ncbi:hypothetical protein cand_011780 [Cryptosporidium andersoni]|uniref:Uncharacterized protein n=1 Tax=Cryptosporidium andersoni TaxID=117008 RepID=A0A1J4MEI0_9CRYT|nr:hypothetical protein cand_011780 [Cryptosporidium andersoni]
MKNQSFCANKFASLIYIFILLNIYIKSNRIVYGSNINENSQSNSNNWKQELLIRATCGPDGNGFSNNKSFVESKLKIFANDEFNKLVSLDKLPIIYTGKNISMMRKAFRLGEILKAPLRLRERIIQDPESIPIIEDDYLLMSHIPEERVNNRMEVVYNRVANEIRYTVLLCGGELISIIPIIKYIMQLKSVGNDLSGDSIILESLNIYNKEKVRYRRKMAELSTRYLSTLPYANEIYFGSKNIRPRGRLIGIPKLVKSEIESTKDKDFSIGSVSDENEIGGAIIGRNIRAKEKYFDNNFEYDNFGLLEDLEKFSSIFELDTPKALFSIGNKQDLPVMLTPIADVMSTKNSRGVIPHSITRAAINKETVISRIRGDLEKIKQENKVEELGSSIISETEKSEDEFLDIYNDSYDSKSILIRRRIRPNDSLFTDMNEEVYVDSKTSSELQIPLVKGFPIWEKIPEFLTNMIDKIQNKDFLDKVRSLDEKDKVLKEAIVKFPVYLSQTKILRLEHQLFFFWESLRLSNILMDQKYDSCLANFPDRNNVPNLDILPSQIPRTDKSIAESCFILLKFFKNKKIPLKFRVLKKIKIDSNIAKTSYRVQFLSPTKLEEKKEYHNKAKILCFDIFPNILRYVIHFVFNNVIEERQSNYFKYIEKVKDQLKHEDELALQNKYKTELEKRKLITPINISNRIERYENAWRRSIGSLGLVPLATISKNVLEKIHNTIRFGPLIIKQKFNRKPTPEEVRTSIGKTIVKIIDEYYSSIQADYFFLPVDMLQNFTIHITKTLLEVPVDGLLDSILIKPTLLLDMHIDKLTDLSIFDLCAKLLIDIISYHKVRANVSILDKDSEYINLLDSKYSEICIIVSKYLSVNLYNRKLCRYSQSSNFLSEYNKQIQTTFIHQILTDGSSTLPVEFGLQIYQSSYLDIFKRVCEMHGLLVTFLDINLGQKESPILNMMADKTQMELTNETINFHEVVDSIMRSIYIYIVGKSVNQERIVFFNEEIMAKFLLNYLKVNKYNVPDDVNRVKSFYISYKYPWGTQFDEALILWCKSFITALASLKLISDENNIVYTITNIDTVINSMCSLEMIQPMRNHIEYEADEVLRRTFAYHLGIAFVYWIYKKPIPLWSFYDQWSSRFELETNILLSEEPEISLSTFILLKGIADEEYPKLSEPKLKIRPKPEVNINLKKENSVKSKEQFQEDIWINTPIKSLQNGQYSLGYFLFPNTIPVEVMNKMSSNDTLAFTGPHEITWVGASESEFQNMCLGALKNLEIYMKDKLPFRSSLNEYTNIWLTDDISTRDLLCRDIAGRYFYPRSIMNCDEAVMEGALISQKLSVDKERLKRGQWLAIREVSIRRNILASENNLNVAINPKEYPFVNFLPLSSSVVNFIESDEFRQPGGFLRNCRAALDTARTFPKESPYFLKLLDESEETLSSICTDAMNLYYTSSSPMSWDEQQTTFNPLNRENSYYMSRFALGQFRALVDEIKARNLFIDSAIRISDNFHLLNPIIEGLQISDSEAKFVQACFYFLRNCVSKNYIFLNMGYDITNSDKLFHKVCQFASYRYFSTSKPISQSEALNLKEQGVDLDNPWIRRRIKTAQWLIIHQVFQMKAKKYPGGHEVFIREVFDLPKYMQLGEFDTSEKQLPIIEDCMNAIMFILKQNSKNVHKFNRYIGIPKPFCEEVATKYGNTSKY